MEGGMCVCAPACLSGSVGLYRMCSLAIECVLLLTNVFWYSRM